MWPKTVDTMQSLFTAYTILKDAQRQCTSTISAFDAPSQSESIPTANIEIKRYAQLNFQLYFAPILGQDDFNSIVAMLSNSRKFLGVPGDTT